MTTLSLQPDRATAHGDAAPRAEGVTVTLVDAHVHLHACHGVGAVLEAASRNFAAAAAELGIEGRAATCLMLTECAGVNQFQAIRRGEAATGAWSFRPTAEPGALLGSRQGALPMLLVAGRQVRTRERLEVLALACTHDFPDDEPIEAAVEWAVSQGAITVLPWGFGKWSGRRGRIVRRLIQSWGCEIAVGDNGGRPHHSPRPALLRAAVARGLKLLPGTDPLPLRGEELKAGRYGFVLTGPMDLSHPLASLRRCLWLQQTQEFGRRETWSRFVLRQALLRLPKRTASERSKP